MFDGLKKKFSKFINSVTKKEEEEIKTEESIKQEVSSISILPQSTEAQKEVPTKDVNEAPISTIEKEFRQESIKQNIHETKFGSNSDIQKHHFIKEKEYEKDKEDKEDKEDKKVVIHKIPSDKEKNKTEQNEEPYKHTEKIHETNIKHEKESNHLKENQKTNSTNTQVNKDDSNTKNKSIFGKDIKNTYSIETKNVQKPNVTFGTKIKSVFFKEVSIKENDIEPFLEDLRESLLESDVNYDASEKILGSIKTSLLSSKISSKNINSQISGILQDSILKILQKPSKIDLISLASSKKASGEPLKILFIGPNGAGKTTTMAKVATMFIKNDISVVMSASDTFRAAAIEQTVIHAERLGVNVIKGKYNADPASVAFDAIAHAKAHHINVVLIDSAGRQETNKSLMEEIKKIVRIAKPDLKIFVGEGIAGNALLNQVSEFNSTVGLDGVILTKLDCDAKGGNTISIISETSVPILFFGIGEGYDDLLPYDPNFIVKNIFSAS
ncbi:MAG: signal recognition particle-docking protein FtsY [Candidatus Micrarchaeia archaeon]